MLARSAFLLWRRSYLRSATCCRSSIFYFLRTSSIVCARCVGLIQLYKIQQKQLMQIHSKLKKAAYLCAALAIVQTFIGFFLKSQTCLTEAFKRCIDFLSIGVLLSSTRLSASPPTRTFTYGFSKAEPLCCLCNVIIVFISVLHFLLDTVIPDEAVDGWYEDTNVQSIAVYVLALVFYGVLRLVLNGRGRGKGPRVDYPEEEVLALQGGGAGEGGRQTAKQTETGRDDRDKAASKTLHFKQFTRLPPPTNAHPDAPSNCLVCSHQSLIIATLNFRICANTLLYLHEILALVIAESEIDTDGTYEYAFNVLWACVTALLILLTSFAIVRESVVILLDGFVSHSLFIAVKRELKKLGVRYTELRFWNLGTRRYAASIRVESLGARHEVQQVFQENNIDIVMECMQI